MILMTVAYKVVGTRYFESKGIEISDPIDY